MDNQTRKLANRNENGPKKGKVVTSMVKSELNTDGIIGKELTVGMSTLLLLEMPDAAK